MNTANLQSLTVKQAARVMNVSERSVYDAGKLIATGRTDLIEKVERGEMRLNRALILAGVRAKPKKGNTLLNAWRKASESERNEFIDFLSMNDVKK